jgi:hypothetical protein
LVLPPIGIDIVICSLASSVSEDTGQPNCPRIKGVKALRGVRRGIEPGLADAGQIPRSKNQNFCSCARAADCVLQRGPVRNLYQRHFCEAIISWRKRAPTPIIWGVEDKDASQEALEQVEKATDSDRAKGEDLFGSEDLKRKLREAKKREQKDHSRRN